MALEADISRSRSGMQDVVRDSTVRLAQRRTACKVAVRPNVVVMDITYMSQVRWVPAVTGFWGIRGLETKATLTRCPFR